MLVVSLLLSFWLSVLSLCNICCARMLVVSLLLSCCLSVLSYVTFVVPGCWWWVCCCPAGCLSSLAGSCWLRQVPREVAQHLTEITRVNLFYINTVLAASFQRCTASKEQWHKITEGFLCLFLLKKVFSISCWGYYYFYHEMSWFKKIDPAANERFKTFNLVLT